jgi:hypothetical protein
MFQTLRLSQQVERKLPRNNLNQQIAWIEYRKPSCTAIYRVQPIGSIAGFHHSPLLI